MNSVSSVPRLVNTVKPSGRVEGEEHESVTKEMNMTRKRVILNDRERERVTFFEPGQGVINQPGLDSVCGNGVRFTTEYVHGFFLISLVDENVTPVQVSADGHNGRVKLTVDVEAMAFT